MSLFEAAAVEAHPVQAPYGRRESADPAGQFDAGPAGTRLHRADGQVEHLRNLFDLQSVNLLEQDDLAVLFAHGVQRAVEQGLAIRTCRGVFRARPAARQFDAVVEDQVRSRGSGRAPAQPIDADVPRDSQQPGNEGRRAIVAIQPFVDPDEDVLGHIAGFVGVAHVVVGHGVHAGLKSAHESLPGQAITPAATVHERRDVCQRNSRSVRSVVSARQS